MRYAKGDDVNRSDSRMEFSCYISSIIYSSSYNNLSPTLNSLTLTFCLSECLQPRGTLIIERTHRVHSSRLARISGTADECKGQRGNGPFAYNVRHISANIKEIKMKSLYPPAGNTAWLFKLAIFGLAFHCCK